MSNDYKVLKDFKDLTKISQRWIYLMSKIAHISNDLKMKQFNKQKFHQDFKHFKDFTRL